MGVAYSAPLCPSAVLIASATHSSSPEFGNGLSWPEPQCTCNAVVISQAQHSTNVRVLRSNSACSMLMSDDLRLPRRGLEPPGSEKSTLPLDHCPSPRCQEVRRYAIFSPPSPPSFQLYYCLKRTLVSGFVGGRQPNLSFKPIPHLTSGTG